jgi:osmotically-inducible protein OsmY
MARMTSTLVAAAVLSLSGVALVGCATASTPPKAHETAGEYLDDSVITTKVKAALVDEPSLKSFQISVKTYQNKVQLSGFVDSAEARQLAGRVTSGVHGVASVSNDLIVK